MEESRRSTRSTAFLIGGIAATFLLAFAVIYANSYSTRVVTANTRALHWTNANLGSAAVVRAASSQAVLFARDVANGNSSPTAGSVAVSEAERTIGLFADGREGAKQALGAAVPDIDRLADEIVVVAGSVVREASSGDWEAALEIFNDEFEPSYSEYTERLAAEQQEILARIDATDDFAGFIAGAIRFAIVLLLPIIALVTYRRIVARQIREERQLLNTQLEYERKLGQSKDDLIAGLSHQLRTPLTTIYGMSHVLTGDSIDDPGTVQEFLEIIHSESYELDRMVSDLLAMARLEADAAEFTSEPVEIAEAVRLAVEPARRAGHQIEVMPSEAEVALADQARVVHILRTLLSNANKHGGDRCRVAMGRQGSDVVVIVEDNGAGVKNPDRIFAGFANEGKEALLSGSVGVGLAVAQTMATRMGGSIEYKRKDGGTYFVLSLPNARTDSPADVEAEEVEVSAV